MVRTLTEIPDKKLTPKNFWFNGKYEKSSAQVNLKNIFNIWIFLLVFNILLFLLVIQTNKQKIQEHADQPEIKCFI